MHASVLESVLLLCIRSQPNSIVCIVVTLVSYCNLHKDARENKQHCNGAM